LENRRGDQQNGGKEGPQPNASAAQPIRHNADDGEHGADEQSE
jgi:hypothetical protein